MERKSEWFLTLLVVGLHDQQHIFSLYENTNVELKKKKECVPHFAGQAYASCDNPTYL